MSQIWDWVNSVNYTKVNLLKENEDIKEYVPFVVNKSMSYHLDAVMFSNEMNRLFHIPSSAQYEFYLNVLPRRKRFSKWEKREVSSDIELIKQYYGINTTKALEVLELLSKTQIEYIKNKLENCGLKQ